ncbi:MAG TPA: hypothetical protein PK014_02215 [Thermoanaerobaculia bacterium]|nr:hypothetical protein [Thermoanaerobaculia bacterium]HUM28952.1 hypothetical protein [Thermoanaerobaculia bacterium]HXK67116.1 hypothetical protein [Thermoanaerobaculia bacterium]
MATVICKTCEQDVKFDETRLPQQVVSFSCPSCKAKITYDNRPKGHRMTISNVTLKPMDKEKLSEMNILGTSTRGEGPVACILFKDGKIAPLITAGLEELGFHVEELFEDTEKAAEFIRKETPDLLFIVIPEIDGPPSSLVKELLIVSADARRKIFTAIMADNVKSNDGNAAFLFNVNCLIAKSDLDRFHHLLFDSIREHKKLYHHYFRLKEVKNIL